jgi:hypothetical protein
MASRLSVTGTAPESSPAAPADAAAPAEGAAPAPASAAEPAPAAAGAAFAGEGATVECPCLPAAISALFVSRAAS